jgi:16S rRNA (adenine1518-N6/adenine1519-N6)-dimethyltransferase
VAVIGNLPYNIVSQIMFGLMEAPAGAVRLAVVMMQREVAERVTARPRTKAYGILSVICQLYARPEVLFGVPPACFTPRPKVDSAMVRFDFEAHEELDVFNTTLTGGLRIVVRAAFNQRRKTLRNSLRVLCEDKGVELPDRWTARRAEELPPVEFLELTRFVFEKELRDPVLSDRDCVDARPDSVWRAQV